MRDARSELYFGFRHRKHVDENLVERIVRAWCVAPIIGARANELDETWIKNKVAHVAKYGFVLLSLPNGVGPTGTLDARFVFGLVGAPFEHDGRIIKVASFEKEPGAWGDVLQSPCAIDPSDQAQIDWMMASMLRIFEVLTPDFVFGTTLHEIVKSARVPVQSRLWPLVMTTDAKTVEHYLTQGAVSFGKTRWDAEILRLES